jgi:two-component system, cell cycle response regulator
MNHKSIVIGCAGLMPNELSALKSVCAISRMAARACHFTVAAEGAPADVVVLAGPEGAKATGTLVTSSTRAVLWIGEESPLPRAMIKQVMQRPLLASRLLGALDRLFETLAAAAAAQAPAANMPSAPAFQPNVLVVDDSPTVRKQLELVLTGMDAKVTTAITGEDALEKMKRQRFDLVLLDVVLPGNDGYTICRAIKREPKTRLTPVVMLTSKSSPFDKIRGTLAGCDNYLTKPATQDDFERTVKRYLQAPASVFQVSEILRTA